MQAKAKGDFCSAQDGSQVSRHPSSGKNPAPLLKDAPCLKGRNPCFHGAAAPPMKFDATQVSFSQQTSLQIWHFVKRFVTLSPNLCSSILALNVTLEINVYKSAHCVFVLKLKASL